MIREEIVRVFETEKPTTVSQLKKLFPECARLGSGVFRLIFRVGDGCIAKLPARKFAARGLAHSRREIQFLQEARRSANWDVLQYCVPALLYSDHENGVVVMTYHESKKAAPDKETSQ